MTVHVRFTARGAYHYSLNFGYDPTLVALVKSVPSFARTYDPATKTWMVTAEYAQQLADDLRAAGYTVLGVEQRNDWAVMLLRRVGPQRADQVIRALTRIVHPDVPETGDAQLQRDLNTARDQLDYKTGK